MRLLFLVTLLVALAPGRDARALTPGCDGLEPEVKERLAKLLARFSGYGCCTESLARCLEAKPECRATFHAAEDLCRRARLGEETEEGLTRAYEKRKRSLTNEPTGRFALDPANVIGRADAPVVAVLYVCSRCPYCREVTLGLAREVTKGELAGRVALHLRPFPLKGHDGATEGDLALMAAAQLGKLPAYALFQFKHFSEFHPAVLADWAEFAGLDRAAFEKALADPKTREALAESKKEGLRNKVEGTPTLFIDGRRYEYDLDPAVLVQVLEEEAGRRATVASPRSP